MYPSILQQLAAQHVQEMIAYAGDRRRSRQARQARRGRRHGTPRQMTQAAVARSRAEPGPRSTNAAAAVPAAEQAGDLAGSRS